MPIFKIQDPDTGRTLRVEMDSAPTQEDAEEIFASAPPSVGAMREMESRPVGQGGLGPKQRSIGELREMESRPMGQGGVGPKPSMADIEQEYEQRLKPKSDEERQAALTAPFLRVGVPIAATMAFPPAAGATVPELLALAGGYSLAGAGGELAAQAVEGKIEPKKVAGAAIRSAVPMPAGRIVAPMATQAAANLTARYVEEGGITPGGAALDVGVPALLGTLGAAGRSLRGGADILEEGANRAQAVEQMAPGMRSTVGQAFTELAPTEQRLSAKTSGGRQLAGQLEEQQQLLVDELNRIKGGESGGVQNVVNRLGRFLGVREANELSNQAARIDRIDNALERVRGTAQEQVLRQSREDLVNQFQQRAQTALIGAGPAPFYREVESGRLMEGIGESLRSSFRNRANQLYAPAQPFMDRYVLTIPNNIETQARRIAEQIPSTHSGGLSELMRVIDRGTPATYNEIRGVIGQLYDFADYSGNAVGNAAQRQIRGLAEDISGSVQRQVQTVFPPDAANAIVQGNRFYAQNRPRFDSYAVRSLFAPETRRTGQGTQSAVSAIGRQGLDAPEIDNLVQLHQSLRSSGAVVPSINPILSNIRAGILSEFVDQETRAIRPDAFEALATRLAGIENQTPGSLSRLGFGNRNEIRNFVNFLRESRNLTGPQATEELLRTGTPGWTVVSASLDMAPNVRTAETMMNYLQRQAATGNAAAADALQGVRARAIEELLLTTAGGTRQFSIGRALNELADPVRRAQIEAIIGPRLINTIDTQLVPGMEVMDEAARAAGRAGTTVGGAQIEELISGAERGAANLASGRPGTALLSAVSTLFRNRKYNALANLMAGGAGSAGLRTRAGQLRAWDRILNAPGTTGERAINSSIREALRETIEEQQQEPSPE